MVYHPRVVFEDLLFLSRRTWQVPAAAIAERVRGHSPGAAFCELNRWRGEHGIPRHVFFTLEGPLPATSRARLRVARKPQYVDFESGVLGGLLLDAAARGGALSLQEMLPGPEAMPSRDGRPYAAELILQVDRDG